MTPSSELLRAIQGADLILVRGAQGSGKSTFARYLVEQHDYLLLEPDDFYHAGPLYFWEKQWLKIAHQWNRWRTERALSAGRKVVVAETFYERRHLWPYLAMTPHYQVFRMSGEFENVHGVDPQTVAHVRSAMAPINSEIVLTTDWKAQA